MQEKAHSQKALLASLTSNRFLELILFSTERCNFRCTYCYEDFKIGKMAPDVESGVKNLIRRRIGDLRHLHISWFGGEPLLAADVVERVSVFVSELASELPGLTYTGSMTTNAARLTVLQAERLSAIGVKRYQITIDGNLEQHDKTRLRANGSGSFDQVWGNVVALSQTSLDISIKLRLHITPESLQSQRQMIRTIVNELDERFHIFFHGIGWGGDPREKARYEFSSSDERDRIIAGLYEEYRTALAERYGDRRTFAEAEVPVITACYAAKSNSLAIRADGRIAKCTVALNDDRNTIGHITPQGDVRVDPSKLALWLRGLTTLDKSTLECPLVNLPELHPVQKAP